MQEHTSPPPGELDIGLLRRLARGDQRALGELYDSHGPRLMGIAIRMLGSREDAEDLLHDVFVEVWKKAGDYDPSRGTVRTWIAMRVRSRCLDRLRARKHTEEVEERHLGTEEMNLSLDGPKLDDALQTLPDGQREVVCMVYIDGLSGPEVASALSIPLGTVKSRLAAGLGKLRTQLTEAPS